MNPATLIANRDQKYKMNYLALTDTNLDTVNSGLDVVGILTGSFGLDRSRLPSMLNNSLDYGDQFYVASRWMTDPQLNAYEDCLRSKETQGLVLYVRSWSNDQVRIVGDYHPPYGAPDLLGFLITISGAEAHKAAMQHFH